MDNKTHALLYNLNITLLRYQILLYKVNTSIKIVSYLNLRSPSYAQSLLIGISIRYSKLTKYKSKFVIDKIITAANDYMTYDIRKLHLKYINLQRDIDKLSNILSYIEREEDFLYNHISREVTLNGHSELARLAKSNSIYRDRVYELANRNKTIIKLNMKYITTLHTNTMSLIADVVDQNI